MDGQPPTQTQIYTAPDITRAALDRGRELLAKRAAQAQAIAPEFDGAYTMALLGDLVRAYECAGLSNEDANVAAALRLANVLPALGVEL